MTEQRAALRPRVRLFAVSAGAVFALLLLRNPAVFDRVVYERGDSAANSILASDAKHFELLVGNYSRFRFHHPGPAFLYVQGFGEWLFHDLLGAVPTPWNGQWLALLALNSVLLGLCLAIVHSWTSWRATVLCGAAGLLYFAMKPAMLASAWMPDLYVAPFVLLLLAAASVAAGRVAHLPALALAVGLLVHGHVSFLMFGPVVAGAAVAVSLRTARAEWRAARGAVAGAGAVLALFALPMALHLILHWPGEFGRYLRYGGAGGIPHPADVARYVLGYYATGTVLGAVAFVGYFGGAALLVRRLAPGPPRRFLAAGVCAAALATILFLGYVVRGVDDLRLTYVGQFTRAVPLVLLLVIVAAAASAPAARRAHPWLVAAVLIGALGVGSGAPALGKLPEHAPGMPVVMAELGRYTGGRPAVIEVGHEAWPALTALVVQGERLGPRVCARDPRWEFMLTARYICTPDDLAHGRRAHLTAAPPAGATVIAPVDDSVLVAS
ncbi:hypothetical protein ACTMTJ_12460 [Phytohabitans sp. LJ34]|uniref:hypothetical protein n=1 Tax=Phytohabitans sp. LJ34 TaxID=3452217 RepID=UPI003F8CD9C9